MEENNIILWNLNIKEGTSSIQELGGEKTVLSRRSRANLTHPTLPYSCIHWSNTYPDFKFPTYIVCTSSCSPSVSPETRKHIHDNIILGLDWKRMKRNSIPGQLAAQSRHLPNASSNQTHNSL